MQPQAALGPTSRKVGGGSPPPHQEGHLGGIGGVGAMGTLKEGGQGVQVGLLGGASGRRGRKSGWGSRVPGLLQMCAHGPKTKHGCRAGPTGRALGGLPAVGGHGEGRLPSRVRSLSLRAGETRGLAAPKPQVPPRGLGWGLKTEAPPDPSHVLRGLNAAAARSRDWEVESWGDPHGTPADPAGCAVETAPLPGLRAWYQCPQQSLPSGACGLYRIKGPSGRRARLQICSPRRPCTGAAPPGLAASASSRHPAWALGPSDLPLPAETAAPLTPTRRHPRRHPPGDGLGPSPRARPGPARSSCLGGAVSSVPAQHVCTQVGPGPRTAWGRHRSWQNQTWRSARPARPALQARLLNVAGQLGCESPESRCGAGDSPPGRGNPGGQRCGPENRHGP